MIIYLSLNIRIQKSNETIFFGIPEGKKELDEMFKFRYKSYLRHNYIDKNNSERDVDEYDNGRSSYFVAKVNDKLIGTARIIRDNFLPTEKDCFRFKEPLEIKSIPRSQRAEVGRLIIEKYDENFFLPRHLILIGLFFCIIKFAKEENLLGGYAFIKNSLKVKLDKLKFPFHSVNNFEKIYFSGTLKKYFENKNDIVWPIYYFTSEIENYVNKILSNRLLFIFDSRKVITLRSKKIFNLYIFLNAI